MGEDRTKTIRELNDAIRDGGCVVAAVELPGSSPTAGTARHGVDAVTSATLKNNVYMKPIPVLMPPVPKKT